MISAGKKDVYYNLDTTLTAPSSAPDELDRVEKEKKQEEEDAIKQAEKAERISKNNNTEIIETPNKTTYSSNV